MANANFDWDAFWGWITLALVVTVMTVGIAGNAVYATYKGQETKQQCLQKYTPLDCKNGNGYSGR